MNEHDPLELELAALRPVAPSPQMNERINDLLSVYPVDEPIRQINSAWQRGAAVAALLAASLAAVTLWRGDVRTNTPDARLEAAELDLRTIFDGSSPSLWSYRRALCHSVEAVDDLLDKHASQSLEPKRSAPPLVLARFSFQRNSFTGEL